jgi:hypothetical protein
VIVRQVVVRADILDLGQGQWIDRRLQEMRLLRRIGLVHVDPRAFQRVEDVAAGLRRDVQPGLGKRAGIVVLAVVADDPDIVGQVREIERLAFDQDRVAADVEILDPAHDESRHVVDIGEVKDVFARPAAHMMAMGEARNGGEIEIGQVIAVGRVGVDLGQVVLRRSP